MLLEGKNALVTGGSQGIGAAAALELAPRCRRYGVPLIVNDRLDIALAAGADGVVIGSDGTAPAWPSTRRMAPYTPPVGTGAFWRWSPLPDASFGSWSCQAPSAASQTTARCRPLLQSSWRR